MSTFKLNEIISATDGAVLKKVYTEFSGVNTDTRKIVAGEIFIALSGENFDGHNFITLAIEKGATGLVISKDFKYDLADNITVITVANPLKAYQQIARCYRDKFDIPIVAITGSNGKTTTKDLAAAVLSAKYNVHKTAGNFNNEIGLPLTLLQLQPQHEVAVVEMGMRGLGHIKELTQIAKPNIAIVTNVGETHMELLGNIDNIAKAKSELVQAIPAEGLVILNSDDENVKKMAEKTLAEVIYFGIDNEADVKATDIEYYQTETKFNYTYQNQKYCCRVPLVGKHNLYNSLAAIALGHRMKLESQELQKGLDQLSLSAMRLAVMKLKDYTFINDAYNASPMSMNAAIESLSKIAPNRKVAVLGDMLELGDISKDAHLKIGDILAKNKVELVITLGEAAKNIAVQAKNNGIINVYEAVDHEDIKNILRKNLKAGDTVLIKGSRGMKMEKTLEGLF